MSLRKLVVLVIVMVFMICFSLSIANAETQTSQKQFLKIDVKDIVAVQTITGTLEITFANLTQSFQISVQPNQTIQATAQFPYNQGAWKITLESSNTTVMDLSGQLYMNGSCYIASYDDTSYFLKQFLSLDREEQSVTITVGYSEGSVAMYAQTKDNSTYAIQILADFNGDGQIENNENFIFTQNGPIINVSTPVQQGLALLMNINVIVSDQNNIVASMNRTYDLATGAKLSGSKDIDDTSRMAIFDPMITTIPYVATLNLNNTDLIKATYTGTAVAQTGIRISDPTLIESVPASDINQLPAKSNETYTAPITTATPTSTVSNPLTGISNWIQNEIAGLSRTLGVSANWLWIGIAVGVILLLITAIYTLTR